MKLTNVVTIKLGKPQGVAHSGSIHAVVQALS